MEFAANGHFKLFHSMRLSQSQLLRSWSFQEPQIECDKHQDDSDVRHQSLPEPVSKEQDVHADHDGDQREHVKHDGCLSSHSTILLRGVAAAGAG